MGAGKYTRKRKFSELLFACNLVPVRDHAASICYNAEIPFGIGYRSSNGKYKIQNHFICSNDEKRLVIITSPEIAYDILNDDPDCKNSESYMLFLDEPTVGADNYGSETLETNMKVLSVAPKRTILSSATFPDPEIIPDIIGYIKKKNPLIATTTYIQMKFKLDAIFKHLNLIWLFLI